MARQPRTMVVVELAEALNGLIATFVARDGSPPLGSEILSAVASLHLKMLKSAIEMSDGISRQACVDSLHQIATLLADEKNPM